MVTNMVYCHIHWRIGQFILLSRCSNHSAANATSIYKKNVNSNNLKYANMPVRQKHHIKMIRSKVQRVNVRQNKNLILYFDIIDGKIDAT